MQETGTNRPPWDAEKTDPDIAFQLKTAFQEVEDPELGFSVIQLGLIRNVKLEADAALVEMILTSPFCPYGPAIIEMVREKAEKTLNRPVSMALGDEVWDYPMMEEGLIDDWGLY